MEWKIGDWAEVEAWESKLGWYRITGFILKVDKKNDHAKIHITRISKDIKGVSPSHQVGNTLIMKMNRLEYSPMYDAKEMYYQLMRDISLIQHCKKEFDLYSDLIEGLKDDEDSENTEKEVK